MYVTFDGLLYIRLYLFSFHDFFVFHYNGNTIVLSILAVSTLLPSSESVGTYCICTNAHIDKLEIKRFVWTFISVCTVNA